MMRLTKSPLFDSRFVSHRHIWVKENDACYECIDKSNYSSVVVRLQRQKANIEMLKDGIEKAIENAIHHPNLCNLKEVLIDAENNIIISCSENARGISLPRFVTLSFTKLGYPEAIQQILFNLLDLYRVLVADDKDLSSLNLDHIIVNLNNQETIEIESLKIRRPFLCKYGPRAFDLPYKNYASTTFPAFVDIGATAFYCFTQNHFLSYSNLSEAIEALEKPNEKLFVERIFGFKTPEFDAVEELIENMYNLSTASATPLSGDDGSEEESDDYNEEVTKTVIGNVVDDYESDTESTQDDSDENESAISSDDDDETQTAIEDNSVEVKTAISDDEIESALDTDETQSDLGGDDSDELESAIGDEDIQAIAQDIADDDETQTAIKNDDEVVETHADIIGEDIDETQTVMANDDFDTQTAIEGDSDEISTAICDDDDVDDFETETAIEDDSDEIKVFDKFDDEEEDVTATLSDSMEKLNEAFEQQNSCNIIKNGLSLASIDGDNSDDVFDTRSLISNESDYDVIDIIDTQEDEAIFTSKNYGIEGLTIKVYKKNFVSYKFGDGSGENGYFDSSNVEMISALPENVSQIMSIIRDVIAMAQSINATCPTKKYLVTFMEEK